MNCSRLLLFMLSLTLLGSCSTAEEPLSPSRIETVDSVWVESLATYKTLRVYLPVGYDQASSGFPVIYLHDGQNLFYDSTSFVGEWGVDESMDSLYDAIGLQAIAVGIDHGNDKRIAEYSIYDSKYATASGSAHLLFLKNQLKPWVDATYKTNPTPEATVVMGSSLGALISHYAFFQNQEVFGKVGIFSPAYWFDTLSLPLASTLLPEKSRVYLYGGGKEGSNMVGYMQDVEQKLLAFEGNAGRVKVSVDSLGEHKERYWRSEFPKAVAWLLEDAKDLR